MAWRPPKWWAVVEHVCSAVVCSEVVRAVLMLPCRPSALPRPTDGGKHVGTMIRTSAHSG
jgi:hypothetical protein